MSDTYDFAVNGAPQSVAADGATPLLDVLRNTLNLKGTRFGCGLEQCGACMVLVDGEPQYACNFPVEAVAGKSVNQRSTVSLVISKGPPLVAVPNVLDRKVAEATAALEAAGFRVKVNKPPIVILDRVLTQSPGGGTQAPKGSTITITAI